MYFQKHTLTYKAWLIAYPLLTIFFLITLSSVVLAQQDYIDYKIQQGDCLWTIAKQFQLSIQEIANTNSLDIGETLQPGFLLKIPQNESNKPTSGKSDTNIIHTVRKGENLWDIAQQYHLSLEYLSRVNELQKPNALYIGQEIKIPLSGESEQEELASTACDRQTVLSFQEEKADLKDITSSLNQGFRETFNEIPYVVKPGENLWIIAQQYQVSLNELSAANSLENEERLSIGQIIKIPLRGKEVETKAVKTDDEEEPVSNCIEHIVVYGENISIIAQKYHLPVEALCQLNQISLKDYIYPGQRLKIKVSEQVLPEIALQEDLGNNQNTTKANEQKTELETVYYTVQPGDTLWDIAQRHCVSIEGIVAVNYLTSKDKLSVGQRLQIPAIGGDIIKKQIIEYTVVKGDSLWNISQKFNVKMHEIINLNQLQNVTQLSIGQKLNIPSSEVVAQESTGTSVVTQKIETKDIIHIVQKGETLWQIAHRYQVTLQSITNANRISENSKILVGQKLVIPNARTIPGASGSPSFVWPLNGLITSHYGLRTLGGRSDYHTGIDIGCCTGTSIRAAESGKVSFVGTLSGYGKTIIIDHAGGYSTVYSHNSTNLMNKGDNVNKGDIIARVGTTGNATGPHLHFEVRVNGKPDNPLNYLP